MNHSPFYDVTELQKSFDFSPWGGIEGFLKASSNGANANNRGVALKRVVPDLSRAVDMTGTAISSLPFYIKNIASGEIVDDYKNWKNEIGGIPDPKRLFYLLASSLCGGAAYLIPQRTPRYIYDLQYVVPHSITPQIRMEGLEYFDRATDLGKTAKYNPKEIIYFWLPDSDVEIGPALNTPLSSAATDAELILNSTNTMRIYGERGWVPIMALGAKGMPNPAEREKAEGFFDRLLKGGFEVMAKIINSDALSVIKIGAGLEDLKGSYVEIKRESSESIAKAFGIPSAMFMSDNAFASEFDALTRQWYTTSRFRSIYQTIEGTFNQQILKQYGVTLSFELQELDIFQEDEASRSASLSSLVSAIDTNPKIAKFGMDILGYDMTDDEEITLNEIIADKEAAKEKMEEKLAADKQPINEQSKDNVEPVADEKPKTNVTNLSPDEMKDFSLWYTKARAWYAKGKGCAVDWENKHLREEIAAPIRLRLANVKTEADIEKAFELSDTSDVMLFAPQVKALQELADAINRAMDEK